MNATDAFLIAVQSILKNRLRASLTILGIVIGIAAVTTMVSLGKSAEAQVVGQFQSLGSNLIIVIPGAEESNGPPVGLELTLTPEDAAAIANECPSIRAVSPTVTLAGQVIAGNVNCAPKDMLGVGADFLRIRDWPLAQGEFFSEREIRSAEKVCVIGNTVATTLFGAVSPIGQRLRLKNVPLRVTGVLETKGANFAGMDQDDILLTPYTTAQKRLTGGDTKHIGMIIASAQDGPDGANAETEITALLRDRHRLTPAELSDFKIRNATEIANILSSVAFTLSLMLASLAGLSLVVGGVGIMNVMLLSVTERTREIGVRMALGASPNDILIQFLTEAALLSLTGGFAGVVGGILLSTGIIQTINALTTGAAWPLIISWPAAFASLAFSGFVGIFFGYYPARRASQLDPIEALRFE